MRGDGSVPPCKYHVNGYDHTNDDDDEEGYSSNTSTNSIIVDIATCGTRCASVP